MINKSIELVVALAVISSCSVIKPRSVQMSSCCLRSLDLNKWARCFKYGCDKNISFCRHKFIRRTNVSANEMRRHDLPTYHQSFD